MTQAWSNNATTTLSGDITATQTTLTVIGAAGFPTSSLAYTILIDSEYMLVTAGQGTNAWTVTRGVEGSTAAAHNGTTSPAAVQLEFTTGVATALADGGPNNTWTFLRPSGMIGATAQTRYAGGTTSGAPASGTFSVGDMVTAQDGNVWVCTTAGSPGTWRNVGAQPGTVLNSAHFTTPNWQTSLSTFQMVNAATALAVVAPPSGKMLLICSTEFNNAAAGPQFLMAWSNGTTNNTNIVTDAAKSGSIDGSRFLVMECEWDSATPGTAYTMGCQWAVTTVAGTVFAGNGECDVKIRAIAL